MEVMMTPLRLLLLVLVVIAALSTVAYHYPLIG